ncbi:MAG TPA: adenylyltransferase/cytidyltransferase family protein [Candidatus Binataceae bacterium]|nr:adenylyltransferase/cytidyltransferase family protein [Candidatus Binataceae bacterium]
MIYPTWREFLPERERLRAARLKLVFTNGCYDLLHPGHLKTLEASRALGDRLIVAINTDAGVRSMKGPDRPITPEGERAEVLDALEFVDDVTFFGEPTPLEIIIALRPDVLVKGADWGAGAVVGEPEVLAWGGKVARIPLAPGYSTSAIIAAIQSGTPLAAPR